MNPATVSLIIAIVGLVVEKGPAIAQSLVNALNKDEITLEDIEALKIVKEPEEY